MQTIIISGNLGRDAELKQTQSGDDVLGFSVGVKQGYGDRASTNWYRCSVWGKRARSLAEYLRKGTKVVAQGELTIGSYEGKPQFDVRVSEVEFMSARGDAQSGGGSSSRGTSDGSRAGGDGFGNSSGYDDLSDDVPFLTSDIRAELRAS